MKIKMEYLVEVNIYYWLLYLYRARLTPSLAETDYTDVREVQDLEISQTDDLSLIVSASC